jgi:hypothetical protein
MGFRRWATVVSLSVVLFSSLFATDARAYINQADGTVVPQTTRLQQCLDLPATAETTVGAVDAISAAAVLPEAYRPVLDATSGHYRVTFIDIGEGAGFYNSFGWFWVGTDVTNPANLHTVFGCRTYGTCNCPCTTTRTVTIDFDTQTGFSPGRPISFWIRTPERLDGSREAGALPTGCTLPVGCDPAGANVDDSCGGRLDSNNRIYFTSQALNDDGDYRHFLVYRSATRTNTYYFGFEDLYRGGDNDFEDMLVRGTGLVPDCDPRAEACDNSDNDCDGLVDEGVTQACSTACGAGTQTCSAGSFGACSARVPAAETCNNVDDNCNGATDEGLSRACSSVCGPGTEICIAGAWAGCTAPAPGIESCNGLDDDCDSIIDEDLMRACATLCGSGVEMCVAGAYAGCTAPMPGVESCNGMDDNCNGQVDEGLTRSCSSACGMGTEVCVAGSYVGCTAPTPRVEACNGLDDDCNGLVDDGLMRECSSACGTGTETCMAGAWGGCDAPAPGVETCNGLDDDCDGVVDDGNPGGGAACVPLPDGGIGAVIDGAGPDGGGSVDGGVVCATGRVVCVDGALTCRGSTSGSREVCNCLDDDCDGNIDEEASGDLCPGGLCFATECQCVDPCGGGEFAACPPGRTCDESLGDPAMGIRGYCVVGMCAGVTCTGMGVCDPLTGQCHDPCAGVTCQPGFMCFGGGCVLDSCYGRGCPRGQVCRTPASGSPACVDDPCASVTCPSGSFCADGACQRECVGGCRFDQACQDGTCVDVPCDGACTPTQSCVSGSCVNNACTMTCGLGRVCRGDTCIDDPCATVHCPSGLACREGLCRGTGVGSGPQLGLATGGGGFCAVAGAGAGTGGRASLALVALGLAIVALRRRRPARFGAGAAIGVVIVALGSAGCSIQPYCFNGCGDRNSTLDGSVDGSRDAGPRTDTNVRVDGCVPSGAETCNNLDDDCNGVIDDGFDVNTDPANCGRCGNACAVPHAFPACTAGSCAIDHCQMGWHDIDGLLSNGCEYNCPPSGDEICDHLDNDCDTRIDEGIDLTSDLANCGSCGNLCALSGATARCASSACVLESCRPGFVDADGIASNGCEYRCTVTSATESCNGVDDNCNGMVDEGFDTSSDARNCGTCGTACSFPHAAARCAAGVCTFGPGDCLPGFFDVDGNPLDGCEYMCVPTGGPDVCDGMDQDCDGRVDEAEPMVGSTCGTSTGACSTGVTVCVLGALACSGDIGPTAESCNGVDDDCDGRTDESTAAAPIPSVGDRCGTSNVGRCVYGQIVCTGGALVCGGTLVGPTTETCNGIDDDCNGAVDDRLTVPAPATVASCVETRGVCAGRTPTCRGAAGWACDLPTTYQAVETICDGLNNDCDATSDEGCINPAGSDVRLDSMDAQSLTNSLDPIVLGTGSGATARVHVAWRDLTGGTVPHVYTLRSTDGGGTFSATSRIDTAGGPVFAPRLALPGTTGVVWGWPDFRGGTSYRESYTRRSADSGATLQAEVKANAMGTTATQDSYDLSLASSGTNVYATYNTFTGTRQRHVFVVRSTDSGATWGLPIQLSTPTGTSFVAAEPRIAAAGTNVYVVWRDNRSGSLDVYARSSTDSGATFGAETRLDLGTAAGSSSSFSPAIAASGTSAWAVWIDDRDAGSFDIWMNRTSNSGGTWLAGAVQLDQDPLHHDSIEPHVTSPATGVVLVSWLDYRFGQPDPYVVRSGDGGATFAAPIRLDTGTTPGASASHDLDFASSGSLIAAVWSDARSGLSDVYANYSLDQGVTWQPQDYRLDTGTAGAADSETPSVWVTTGAFHVAWVDHRRGASCPYAGTTSCPNGDIYYRRVQ